MRFSFDAIAGAFVVATAVWLFADNAWRDNACASACQLKHGINGECLWTIDRDLCLCGSGDARQVICRDADGCTGVGK